MAGALLRTSGTFEDTTPKAIDMTWSNSRHRTTRCRHREIGREERTDDEAIHILGLDRFVGDSSR